MASKRDARGVRTLDFTGYKPGGSKAEVVDPNMDDIAALLEVADSRLRAKQTVQNFPPTSEGLDRFKAATSEYFRYIIEKNRDLEENKDAKPLVPDLEGWASYIGISRKTLYNYEQRGGDWKKLIEYCKNSICSVKKQLSFTYKIPPVLAMFDLANNHSYKNTSEFHVTAESARDREESKLTDELAGSGLYWDESRGEYLPVSDKGAL